MADKRYLIKATTYDKRGRLISSATNDYCKTHPKQAEWANHVGLPEKTMLHAEVAAIIKSKGKPIHKIVVERYDVNGNPKNACPCKVCQWAIKETGIKFVEYTVG